MQRKQYRQKERILPTQTALRVGRVVILVILMFGVPEETFAGQNRKQKPNSKAAFQPHSKTAESEKGKILFEANKCATCHTISGAGGCLAPPLDGIAVRRSERFLKARISKGEKFEDEFTSKYGTELMPHLRVEPAQAQAIVQYLITLPEPKNGFKVKGHHGDTTSDSQHHLVSKASATEAESAKHGRSLLSSKGCLACHSIGGLGGSFAPKFDGIGSRATKDTVRKQMKNAELLTLMDGSEYGARGTVMPPLDLSDKEIESIANYLMTLK